MVLSLAERKRAQKYKGLQIKSVFRYRREGEKKKKKGIFQGL